MNEPETEGAAKSKRDRQIVWGGCQTVLAFAGLIAAFFVVDWAGGPALRRLSLGSGPGDLIELVYFKRLANTMVVGSLLAVVLGLPLVIHWCKTFRAALLGCAAYLALLVFVVFRLWYVPFVAMEVRGATVRLVHLWPRPATTLHTDTITSTAIEETLTSGQVPQVLERLVIETTNGPYRSMYGGDASGAAERLKRLR